MWVYSISPPSFSLIGPLTTEIYYQTEKKKKLETHTSIHTNRNWYSPHGQYRVE